MERKMEVKVKCHHCGHEWIYRGKGGIYVTCPKCLYKVNLQKHGVLE